MPDRPNCLRGSISQGMPLLSTKTMASSAARSSAQGRPGFFFGFGAGSSRGHALPEGVGNEFAYHSRMVGTVGSGGQSIPYFR